MKPLGLIVLSLVITVGLVRADSLKIGTAAPAVDVQMKNINDTFASISSVKGPKGTLVIFSCNHCPFVRAWESRIVDLADTYGKQGIGVILINANDPAVQTEDDFADMQQRAKEHHYNFPYVVDNGSVVAKAFGASRTPEVFLFDNTSHLVYHGAVDDNKDASNVTKSYLKDALAALAAGQLVATKETKAVGCSISLYKQ